MKTLLVNDLTIFVSSVIAAGLTWLLTGNVIIAVLLSATLLITGIISTELTIVLMERSFGSRRAFLRYCDDFWGFK